MFALDGREHTITERLIDQLSPPLQDIALPRRVIGAECLLQRAFGRGVDHSSAVVMPAIFFSQNTNNFDRAVGAKFVSKKSKASVRKRVRKQLWQSATDAIGGTSFRIHCAYAFTKKRTQAVRAGSIDEQRVAPIFAQAGMYVDGQHRFSRT